MLIASCSDDSPTRPDDQTIKRLAGGGRANSNDPFFGGSEGSGPNDSLPGIPPIEPDDKFMPLLYSDYVCGESPVYLLISDSLAWVEWWNEYTECWFDSSTGWRAPRSGYIRLGDDTGWVDPDSVPIDTIIPEPWGPPYVDFEQNVVIVIGIESSSIPGRYLWLRDVTSNGAGTIVDYEVMIPGEDCYRQPIDSFPSDTLYSFESAPTAAFLVPRPVTEPIDWQRTETVYNCTWQPDPKEPLMLYYTDAPCDLGASEQIITNNDDFQAWIDMAVECDFNRWYDPGDTMLWNDSTGIRIGGGMIPDFNIDVDFATHAVIILRSDELTRWGGGVWLNEFNVSDNGTDIDYSVMQPGEDCPEVEDGTVQPSVAIRVPLPLNQPIIWNRHVESISCDWGDSTIIVGGGGGR
jgi:hypothetical protein